MAILLSLGFLCVIVYLCAIWVESLHWHGGTCRCGAPWSRTHLDASNRGRHYFCTKCHTSISITHPVDKKFKAKYVNWHQVMVDDLKQEA